MMKICLRTSWLLALFILVMVPSVRATVYPLPAQNSRLTGENRHADVAKDSTLPLEAFASHYQLGLTNMMEANPGVNVYLPQQGSTLLIPHQLILPTTVHQGIIINSAEMRLYYYPKNSKTVVVLPIGIGELGRDTPMNWTTRIQSKRANPTWTPTKKMHQEYANRGEHLPDIFPAGPDNPMGLYALYVGRLYAIHGTNADFGIGLRVSHGCVRLRAPDIKWLFNNVPIGTRVQFINEPVKATIEPDGSRYLEVHNPLSTTQEEFDSNATVPITLTPEITKVLADPSVNKEVVAQALRERKGIPVKINAKPAGHEQAATVSVATTDDHPKQTVPDNHAANPKKSAIPEDQGKSTLPTPETRGHSVQANDHTVSKATPPVPKTN